MHVDPRRFADHGVFQAGCVGVALTASETMGLEGARASWATWSRAVRCSPECRPAGWHIAERKGA